LKRNKKDKDLAAVLIVLLLIAFLLIFMVYIHSRVAILEIFPESIWAIFIGIGLGFIIKHLQDIDHEIAKKLAFEPHAFFLFLLPPIMFQAGFSLRFSSFLRNIGIINAFAIGATTLAAFIFSFVFYFGMNNSELEIPYIDSLHFG
jgi:NhaP-type Na+/H+ or K+/H+ antiporter